MNHSGLFNREMPLFMLTIDKAVPIFMILSGYVYALSAEGKTQRELYNINTLKRKFIRFTVPMLIAFVLYISISFIAGYPMGLYEIVKRFLLGNYGQGAYYYHLMIEFIILAPLLYTMIAKFKANGVILLGFANFLYDVFCSAYSFNVALNRVIIFRYLFAIALGMYIVVKKDKKVSPVLLAGMLILGTVYVISPYAWGYSYRLFTTVWGSTSMLSIFYVFPIVYIILDMSKEHNSTTVFGKAAERIGRASFHIMYTQMIFFVVKSGFDKIIFNTEKLGVAGELIFDIVVCVLSGILFEYVIVNVQNCVGAIRKRSSV